MPTNPNPSPEARRETQQETDTRPLKMFVWDGRGKYKVCVCAANVAEARALALEEMSIRGDLLNMREHVEQEQPLIYHRPNAELALTENGETEELNICLEAETKRRQAAESELAALKAQPDGWIEVTERLRQHAIHRGSLLEEALIHLENCDAWDLRGYIHKELARPLPTPPVRDWRGAKGLEGRMAERRNIVKQQEVVDALWSFAADLQLRPEDGQVATSASGPDAGTKCSRKHVRSAMERILKTFGYVIEEEWS